MEIISDTHMHSRFSFDGQDTALEMARAAYERGMKYICFTEHHNESVEIPQFHRQIPYDEYFSAIKTLKEDYCGHMEVLCGIEYDQPELYPEALAELQSYDFDMIMGSMHHVFDVYAGCSAPFKRNMPNEVIAEYYRLTTVAAKQGMIDVVGHFDLVLKCCPDRTLDLKRERLAALEAIAENNIALEINTGGLRCDYGNPYPTQNVIKEFAEVGGKMILFGSDAHCTDDVCKPFDQLRELDLCGLTPGVFIKRKFIPTN